MTIKQFPVLLFILDFLLKNKKVGKPSKVKVQVFCNGDITHVLLFLPLVCVMRTEVLLHLPCDRERSELVLYLANILSTLCLHKVPCLPPALLNHLALSLSLPLYGPVGSDIHAPLLQQKSQGSLHQQLERRFPSRLLCDLRDHP